MPSYTNKRPGKETTITRLSGSSAGNNDRTYLLQTLSKPQTG